MWPFWLSQEVPVALASDDGDLDKVGPVPAKDGWPAPKQLSTVGIGASATVSVTVAKLMHTLSLAYSAPVPTPCSIAQRWALLRYFWAFEKSNDGGLALSPAVEKMSTRQKALLAEDLGIAFTQTVIERVVPAPVDGWQFVDGQLAIGASQVAGVPLVQAEHGGSPDYFFFGGSADELQVLAVEAKGTTGTRWAQQVRHAARQLTCVSLENGGHGETLLPPGFVVSVAPKSGSLLVRVFDPEGDWSGPIRAGKLEDRKASVRRNANGTSSVMDGELFRRDLVDLAAAKVLSYAGEFESAMVRLPQGLRVSRDAIELGVGSPLDRRVVSTEVGEFHGVALRFQVSGGIAIEAFYGAQMSVLEGLREPDPEAGLEAIRAFGVGKSSVAELGLAESNESVVTSYGVDGTLLQVRRTV